MRTSRIFFLMPATLFFCSACHMFSDAKCQYRRYVCEVKWQCHAAHTNIASICRANANQHKCRPNSKCLGMYVCCDCSVKRVYSFDLYHFFFLLQCKSLIIFIVHTVGFMCLFAKMRITNHKYSFHWIGTNWFSFCLMHYTLVCASAPVAPPFCASEERAMISRASCSDASIVFRLQHPVAFSRVPPPHKRALS